MGVNEASTKYSRATGYKQTEVGVIPEDWEVNPLGSVCQVFGRIGFRGYTVKDIVTEGQGAIAINPSNIKNNKIDFSKCTYVTWQKYDESPEIKINVGDVLLVKTGSTFGKTAIVSYLPEKATLNPQVVVLKRIRTDNRFLGYMMAFPIIQNQINSAVVGGALPTLSQNLVSRFSLPFPPTKAEQEAIAEALSDADALIESLEQLLTKKRHLKQGAIQELLTGKKRLPGFSEEWEVKRLGDVADTDPENLGSDTCPTYSFNYISLENVDVGMLRSYSEQIFQTAPSRARRKLRKGDVLVSTVRPNLKSHLLFSLKGDNWVCSTGFCVVRCKEEVANPFFVFSHMFGGDVTRQIEALLTGSNYPAVNSGDVRALQILFPKYEEQTAIATLLSDMDAELAALEEKLAKVRALKQGMMQELLTGRIRLV